MPENSWPESNSYNEFDPLESLWVDIVDADLEPLPRYGEGQVNRRRRAAIALGMIWGGTIALHFFSVGIWMIWAFTTLMGVHALRLLLTQPRTAAATTWEGEDYPFVSLLVAAKNEEAVITRLVQTLCQIDYPSHRYELWIIDDNSSDRTPLLLERLAKDYKQLQVLRRLPGAGGGKSGALNQVLPLTKGEIIGVFDADAEVNADLLQRVLPLFQQEQVGAVQLRKNIINGNTNFWTRGQQVEMVVDAYFQQQRVAIGGIGELRGNGQFVRRRALERCGGWNEQTITDDLDLSLRLHLDQWDIECVLEPAVQEEGVLRAMALWHQRNRWSEGGFQSYLDYWQLLVRNRLGTSKTLDLLMFWTIKYFLPTAAIPDFLMSLARNRPPLFLPLTSLTVALSFIGMIRGLQQVRKANNEPVLPLTTLMQAVQGTLYMLHWFPVVASVTARMSVRPKRLKWVKTVHQGPTESIDVPLEG